ncbi:hypothetical protein F53441_7161 [Fusarium austroafricanum]|uniref:Uncharacterized protein n=1 Tax=Fusarium austroafricanum TaxID=2364996 RepID=A0A8H4NSJ0_9HYPO|nr:hypothetical protein F53441_7161 [Fusarium austroafricanum]
MPRPRSPPRRGEIFEHNICPTLLFGLERLRDGLDYIYGRNVYTVYGDIMQFTVRVNLPKPHDLVKYLQDEGYLRREPLQDIPERVKEQIKANGWYQIQPYDQEERDPGW